MKKSDIILGLSSIAVFCVGKKGSASMQPFGKNINDELTSLFQENYGGTGFGSMSKISINDVFLGSEPSLVSDENLVAILLFGTTGNKNPQKVAKEILASVDGLLGQLMSGPFLASKYPSSSKAKMVAALELARRANYRAFLKGHGSPITNPNQLSRAFLEMNISSGLKESLSVLFLNRNKEIIGSKLLSTGSTRFTLLDEQMILSEALKLSAAAIAVAHNHPSGSFLFSDQDIQVTQKLKRASECVGIQLMDSLVIGKHNQVTSAMELGII